jgi:hypothetical protein
VPPVRSVQHNVATVSETLQGRVDLRDGDDLARGFAALERAICSEVFHLAITHHDEVMLSSDPNDNASADRWLGTRGIDRR